MADRVSELESLRERYGALRARNIPLLIARMRLSAAEIAELQRERLRELLTHAAARSPFYARRLGGADFSRFELADLAHLPIVTKRELMAELDLVFTDRRLSRAAAELALGSTVRDPVPILGEYVAQATGGSSGERGLFVSDLEALSEVLASAMRGVVVHAAGANVIALVAAASPVHSTGLSVGLSDPSKAPIATLAVPVTLPLEEITARLTEIQPQAILGYPSALARLAAEKSAGRLRIEPRLIATTSEMLTPPLREAIRGGFRVPIVDVFGSTEGLMGASAPDDSAIAFNSDVCIVELVDEDERPVPPGVPSDHILVTNLANRVQPLIRYRMDDRFTRQADSLGHGLLRATVEGRVAQTLRWGALEIHPLVTHSVMLKHPEVIDYQARQTPCGMDVSVIASGPVAEAALAEALCAALAGAGLAQAKVRVTRCDSLERNAETGKLRRYVPLPG